MENTIKDTIRLEDDELLVLIGKEFSLGITPLNEDEYKKNGKIWFNSKLSELQDKICNSPQIRSAINSEDIMLCMAIVDAIIGAVTGIAAAAVSVLIMRRGLENFCKVHWQEMDKNQ